MAMTKKDYASVARAVRDQRQHEGHRGNSVLDELIIRLSASFKKENDLFDEDKFKLASSQEARTP